MTLIPFYLISCIDKSRSSATHELRKGLGTHGNQDSSPVPPPKRFVRSVTYRSLSVSSTRYPGKVAYIQQNGVPDLLVFKQDILIVQWFPLEIRNDPQPLDLHILVDQVSSYQYCIESKEAEH